MVVPRYLIQLSCRYRQISTTKVKLIQKNQLDATMIYDL